MALSTAMKRRCLPCYLIIRNIAVLLILIASTVILIAETHTTAMAPNPQTLALKQWFAYHILANRETE